MQSYCQENAIYDLKNVFRNDVCTYFLDNYPSSKL